MAKQINKNWALIESAGYTIECTIGGGLFKQRYHVIPLRDSIAWQIGGASGFAQCCPLDLLATGYGCEIGKRALRPVARAKAAGFGNLDGAQWLAAKHCSACGDCHGFLCIACASAIITPDLARECNGEEAWAAARKGGTLDKVMAEMIAATPTLRAEVERRALAALTPATPTPTRRQSGRL